MLRFSIAWRLFHEAISRRPFGLEPTWVKWQRTLTDRWWETAEH